MIPKAECLEAAGAVLGQALLRISTSDPKEVALQALREGGPSLVELERMAARFQSTLAGTPA